MHKLLNPLPRPATQASVLPGPAQTSPPPGAAAPTFPLTVAAASSQPISLLASLPGPVMMSSRKYLKSWIRKKLLLHRKNSYYFLYVYQVVFCGEGQQMKQFPQSFQLVNVEETRSNWIKLQPALLDEQIILVSGRLFSTCNLTLQVWASGRRQEAAW